MGMPDTLEADIPQIRTISGCFDNHAEELTDIDTSTMRTGAAGGFLRYSATANALGDAENATRRALLILADRAWALHDTMNRVCDDYTQADRYFSDELRKAVPA